jgi:hypothetical protein
MAGSELGGPLILAGMASHYIADPQAWAPEARPAAESVLDVLGDLAVPVMIVLRTRRLARREPCKH